ncbi:MAG: histidine phosphatase family protein [Lachnospiraceae bacterium]|nr:histidine phosphatase family protein [Lachnospiraceae bacterium]
MRIIFVRHGEPDYATDTLTDQGKREAAALAARVKEKKWRVEKCYVSTMGRARETAAPTLEVLGQSAVAYDWLREFDPRIKDPSTGEEHCAWDLQPQDYTADPMMMDPKEWMHSAFYAQYPEIEEEAKKVYKGIDDLVAEYGYIRHGEYFDFVDPTGHVNPAECEDIMLHGTSNYVVRDEDDEKTIVIFCHLGVTGLILSHLLGISPVAIWHGICIPPTGLTVVNTEKRLHNQAHFRIQALGDTAHLYRAGIPLSGYAAFSPVFNG